jgi:hypothetical protein
VLGYPEWQRLGAVLWGAVDVTVTDAVALEHGLERAVLGLGKRVVAEQPSHDALRGEEAKGALEAACLGGRPSVAVELREGRQCA